MSISIETNDMETKAVAAKKFLTKGNKVKAVACFRGREMTHKEQGWRVLENFIQMLGEATKKDGEPKMEGRFLYVFLRSACAKPKNAFVEENIGL